MKCPHCTGEFSAPPGTSVSNCPFCQKPLIEPTVKKDCENLAEVLAFVSASYGNDALLKGEMLVAFMGDYLPKGKAERNFIRNMFIVNIPAKMKDALAKDAAEQQIMMSRFVQTMVDDYSIAESAASGYLWDYAEAIGWQPRPEPQPEAAPASPAGGASPSPTPAPTPVTGAPPTPTPAPAPAPAALASTPPPIYQMDAASAAQYMEDVYQREKGRRLGERFHVTSSIPAKKLDNAKKSYAKTMGADEIPLLLFDNAILSNGKAGFLFTNVSFYCSRLLEKPVTVPLAEIISLYFDDDDLTVQARDKTLVTEMQNLDFDSAKEKNQAIEAMIRIISIVLGI
jgi:hypothetical protein